MHIFHSGFIYKEQGTQIFSLSHFHYEINTKNSHEQPFKSVLFFLLHASSMYGPLSVGSFMQKPRTFQFMCLLFRCSKLQKRTTSTRALGDNWCLPEQRRLKGATMDDCTADSNISVKQHMTHKTVCALFTGWRCHIGFSTKPGVKTSWLTPVNEDGNW